MIIFFTNPRCDHQQKESKHSGLYTVGWKWKKEPHYISYTPIDYK